jgi:thioesterase domain-containing protein
MISFEIAQQLQTTGEEVELLTMLDTPGPGHLPKEPQDHADMLVRIFNELPEAFVEELRERQPEAQLPFLFESAQQANVLPAGTDLADLERQVALFSSLMKAMYAYRPKPYSGSVLFFRARERRSHESQNPELAWIDLAAGGTQVHVVPGNHLTMHSEENLPVVAKVLRDILAKFQARS